MCFVFLFADLQFGENRRLLQVLRTLLEEFREELREEETRRGQLQQSYANDKAAWEVKWAEMKCQVSQVQMASQRPAFKGTGRNLVQKTRGALSKQEDDSKHVASSMDEITLGAKPLTRHNCLCCDL